jgi:hypothetical protein
MRDSRHLLETSITASKSNKLVAVTRSVPDPKILYLMSIWGNMCAFFGEVPSLNSGYAVI